MTTPAAAAAVATALASVDDPGHPGVSIVGLGLVDEVTVVGSTVTVELIPTRATCPALTMIAADVRAAVGAVAGVEEVTVRWHPERPWTPARCTPEAAQLLAEEFTVTLRHNDGSLRCPACGADTVAPVAEVGPATCRSVAWCSSCRNVVEVLGG